MKPEKILYAMNDIDTAFLNEARETAPRRHSRKFVAVLAAVIALMTLTLTAFASEEIAGWFQAFLSTKFVSESWLDASVTEDYSVELLTEPVSGIPSYGFDVEGVIDITVVSVRLRPGSLMLFYHATNSAEYKLLHDYYPGGVKAVTLDGVETFLCLSAVGRVSEELDSLYWVEYAADVPPMDKIDYIELPDGTKLMVP